MRIALLAAVLVGIVTVATLAGDEEADVLVRKWLVLAPVDVVARRPLRPDAVFAKHLLDRAAAPPKEGEEIAGTLGKAAKWAVREADKDGDVELESGGWAYASVESATDRVAVATLQGAAMLFINGAGFTGDVYRLGDLGVPVALKKGANDVYVAGPRGGFRLQFTLFATDRTRVIADSNRAATPDAVEGDDSVQPSCSGLALNRSMRSTEAVAVAPPMVPLGVGRCRELAGGMLVGHTSDWKEPAPKKPGEVRRRTFVSNIDGSVQSYALVPPSPAASADKPVGLVLSLHGAGVECMDQAKAYAPKPDFWIVCPTNRGRYGFDWQDWGRLDAYEVLEDALKVTGVDPRRVYLTGHSMGGHGTWHLAANDPGRFLAIAPSAGWSGFDSYGGSQVMSPLAWMWRAADGASRTLDLIGNLAQIPTYVLHGEKDDNVPVSEAQLMVDAVTKAGGKPEFHVEPGMGHWWDKDEKKPGADCVDWPGIWELFRRTEPKDSPRDISFTTTDVTVNSGPDWFEVLQPIDFGRPCRVNAKWDGASHVDLRTENVRALFLQHPGGVPGGTMGSRDPSWSVTIDGRLFNEGYTFVREGGAWTTLNGQPFAQKFRESMGPFKHVFTNRFVLVYGTAGDDSENRELLEKARYDSEVWAYRANGDANLMSDAQFLAGDFKDRNVIVYGNADTNKAWGAVFDEDCPIVAKRGAMTVNGTKHEGVLASAFVRPRKGSDIALAAAFADTGAKATRLFYAFPVFSSGVGIPDYVVFGPGYLKEMDGDVRAAGWFDYAWRMR